MIMTLLNSTFNQSNSVASLVKLCKRVVTTAAVSLTLLSSANAQQAANLDQLLKQLEQGKIAQSAQNKAREAEFKNKVNQQQSMLNDIQAQRNSALKLSAQLEQSFEANEVKLANKGDALDKRLGELKELFGVLQQVSGDTRSKFQSSVISAQIANRGEFLDQFCYSMGGS